MSRSPTRLAPWSPWIRDMFPVVSVVLLMFIGTFKAMPVVDKLPVDATAIAVGLVGAAIIAKLLTDRGATPFPYGAAVIVGAFLPGFLIGQANPYTPTAQLGVLLTGLTAFGGYWLLGTRRRRTLWCWSLVAVGVAAALLSAPGLDGEASVAGRGTTISTAEALGVAIVVILTLVMHGALGKRLLVPVGLALAAFLALSLFATGSRGPLAGTGVALVLAAVAFRRPGRVKRTVLVAAFLLAGWYALESQTNSGAVRIHMALTGRLDNTASREGVWQQALLAIPLHPEGVGWGNFWSVLPTSAVLNSGYVQHAHNLILDAFVEGGWLAGFALVAFIAVSLRRFKTNANGGDPYDVTLFCVAVFFVTNGMVSGSVAEERATFAALAVAFAIRGSSRGAREDIERSGRVREEGGVAGR